MKFLILFNIISFLLLAICCGQTSLKDSTFSNSCDTKYCNCDSLSIKNEIIKFFLLSKGLSHTDQNNNKFYTGIVILYVDKYKYKKNELKNIFLQLSQKHNLSEFSVFNTCKAYELAISSMKRSPELESYLEDHSLGGFPK